LLVFRGVFMGFKIGDDFASAALREGAPGGMPLPTETEVMNQKTSPSGTDCGVRGKGRGMCASLPHWPWQAEPIRQR